MGWGEEMGPRCDPAPALAHQIRLWVEGLAAQGASFTAQGTILKIKEELDELWDSPDDPMECADIIIAAIVYAHVKGWKIERYIEEKLQINRDRTWSIQPDGSFHHD